ncbi:MAG TPA: hypothetical protein VK646_13575 [Actinomycetota bacterium]|nr:hypothetical protein [Actinomycetota bacterium]
MGASPSAARRSQLEPLSRRGKAAALTTGGCLVIAGVAMIVSAWAELTCPLGGEEGRAICQHMTGVGGVFVMLGILAILAGAVALVSGLRRPVDEAVGLSGWTRAEGLLVAFAGITIAMLIPTYHCPVGYKLTPVFHVCTSPSAIINDPPTWLGWKVLVAVVGLALAIVVARWRRLPWPVASAATVLLFGGAAGWLIQTAVGFP